MFFDRVSVSYCPFAWPFERTRFARKHKRRDLAKWLRWQDVGAAARLHFAAALEIIFYVLSQPRIVIEDVRYVFLFRVVDYGSALVDGATSIVRGGAGRVATLGSMKVVIDVSPTASR